MNDLVYVTHENQILTPLVWLGLALIFASFIAIMVVDAYYNIIPKLSIISGVFGLVMLVGALVYGVSIYDSALKKTSENISLWLQSEKGIQLDSSKIEDILDNDSFTEFLINDVNEIRISKPFTFKGEEYFLVLENKTFILKRMIEY